MMCVIGSDIASNLGNELFIQQFIQANKRNMKTPHYGLCKGIHCWKGPLNGKAFHCLDIIRDIMRATIVQLVASRRLLEGVSANNLGCVLTFIVFKEAFDYIHHGKLMESLRAFAVPEKLLAKS